MVVTDILMPKKDGIELTRELRNMGFTGLIIGVSAATLGEETNDLIAADADSALEKPFTNTMLLEIIKLHWAKRDAQIEH